MLNGNFVSKAFSHLSDAEGNFQSHGLLDIRKLDKHRLCRLGAQVYGAGLSFALYGGPQFGSFQTRTRRSRCVDHSAHRVVAPMEVLNIKLNCRSRSEMGNQA